MASLIPYVEPVVNSAGNPVSTNPKIIFDRALDAGDINTSNFFIVRISKENNTGTDDYLQDANSVDDLIPAKVIHRRINLADNDTYNGFDYGDTGSAGSLYRSEIIIEPTHPLPPNSNFSTIISKKVSLLSIFDPKAGAGNTSSGSITAKGKYEGLTPDTYTITIVSSGGQYSSKYVWTRSSDGGASIAALDSSSKQTEIDRGIKLEFGLGTYEMGDTFTLEVIPRDEQVEIYSWTFSTGLGAYEVPEDDRSGDLVDLPVLDQSAPVEPSTIELVANSISPEFGSTNVRIAAYGKLVLGAVVFSTINKTKDYNGYKVSYLEGGTAGSEVVSQTDKEIEITIESEMSTAQNIVDAFTNSGIAALAGLKATTANEDALQKAPASGRVARGINENSIVITFSEDIDENSIADKIRVTQQGVFPSTEEEDLYFTTSVSGAELTLTIID